MAFVIVAIMAAIVLGMVSPSEPTPTAPGVGEVELSPAPQPTTLDERVPTARPTITNPSEGKTRELEIAVSVSVPEEELPRRLLTLWILRGDEELERVDRPKPGTEVEVKGVRLQTGANELSAVLSGPGGRWGPRSEPVLVTVDRSLTDLAITSPANKFETYDDTVIVEGTSEVGAQVSVQNAANGFGDTERVGPSGKFSVPIRLKRGTNNITASSRDDAKLPQTTTVRVIRLDGRPRIKIKQIGPIRRADLPTNVNVVVSVSDAKGEPIAGATVDYSLGARDRSAETATDVTNARGRSRWPVDVEPSSSTADELQLVVVVTSPASGEKRTAKRTIELR